MAHGENCPKTKDNTSDNKGGGEYRGEGVSDGNKTNDSGKLDRDQENRFHKGIIELMVELKCSYGYQKNWVICALAVL